MCMSLRAYVHINVVIISFFVPLKLFQTDFVINLSLAIVERVRFYLHTSKGSPKEVERPRNQKQFRHGIETLCVSPCPGGRGEVTFLIQGASVAQTWGVWD